MQRRAADLTDRALPAAARGYATAAAALVEADTGLLAAARARLAAGPRPPGHRLGGPRGRLARRATRPRRRQPPAAVHTGRAARRAAPHHRPVGRSRHRTPPAPPRSPPTCPPPARRTLLAWATGTGFAAAADAWTPTALREQVRCLLAAGLHETDPDRAVDALLAAEELADAAGLTVLAGRARRGLRRHGVHRDTRSPRSGAQLTNRETDVLRLVAAGEPTRRIAGQLGISAETVDTHIRAGMRKLGARTRTEAAALAFAAGPGRGPPVTRQPDAPRHVVATGSDADTVLRRLPRDGWALREGFALPDPAWDVTGARLVLHGRITDPDTLQLAVLAAARGAGIVAVCDPETPIGRALVDDLARLGAGAPRRRPGRARRHRRRPGARATRPAGPAGRRRHHRRGGGRRIPVAAHREPAHRRGPRHVRGPHHPRGGPGLPAATPAAVTAHAWPRTAKLDAPRLVERIAEITGVRLVLEGPCPGGEVGAAYVRWPDGRRSVLSEGHTRTGPLLDLARAAGVPDRPAGTVRPHRRRPRHRPAAPARHPAAPASTRALVRQMVALNARLAGLLADRPGVPPVDLYLTTDGPGFCLHEPAGRARPRDRPAARPGSTRSAPPPRRSPATDLVHLDFQPGNVLVDDGRITGVVDCDGAARGDRPPRPGHPALRPDRGGHRTLTGIVDEHLAGADPDRLRALLGAHEPAAGRLVDPPPRRRGRRPWLDVAEQGMR